MELIRSLPETELNRILEETKTGEYAVARELLQTELARRSLSLVADYTGYFDAQNDCIVRGED